VFGLEREDLVVTEMNRRSFSSLSRLAPEKKKTTIRHG